MQKIAAVSPMTLMIISLKQRGHIVRLSLAELFIDEHVLAVVDLDQFGALGRFLRLEELDRTVRHDADALACWSRCSGFPHYCLSL